MNTKPTSPTHVYDFRNPRIFICVKASDLAEAIDTLRLEFGFDWVRNHIDSFDINWYKPNKK